MFQRWNIDNRSTLKICCIFNVVSTLKYHRKFNVENMLHLHNVVSTLKKRRCCNVEISTLNQRWIIVVQRCNLYSTYFQRWNNVACLLGHHCTFNSKANYTKSLYCFKHYHRDLSPVCSVVLYLVNCLEQHSSWLYLICPLQCFHSSECRFSYL